jgi:predicted transcriptional regulator
VSEAVKTAAEIAESLGRNPSTVTRLIRKYAIPREDGGYRVKLVMEAMAKAAQADLRAPLPEGDPRRRKIELENRVLEIKIAESEGALVDAEKVEHEAQRIGAAIKNDLLALPQALAGRLAGQTEPAKISEILDSALRDCLRHLADTICNTPAE